jgi:2-(1,2-epoxy-1,2-dihydrophenyl)acetyl-CoA isomerase
MIQHTTPPIQIETRHGVLVLTLDRPVKLNGIDVEMARMLGDALEAGERDASVRALLIRGNGRAFCAGGDVSAFGAGERHADVAGRTMAIFHPVILKLASLRVPTLAAVHGAVAGAGIGLMLACDFTIAAPQTRFTLAYPKIGATIDGGASWFLVHSLGTRRAKQLAMLSETIDTAAARELGLITRVATSDTIDDESFAFALDLARGPTAALGAIKRLIDTADGRDLGAQLDAERDAFLEIANSADFAEGLDAFKTRREPVFTGGRQCG